MSLRKTISLLFFATASCCTSTLRAEYSTRQFLWEQANTQAASAAKPEDYTKAATTYNRLLAEGVITAPLLLNLGSVQVLSGDTTKAVAAFSRAERYVGTTPEIRQGLLAAFSKQTGQQQKELPWIRSALFWHFSLPCQTRTQIALVGWLFFWGGLLVRRMMKHRKIHALESLAETGIFVGGVTTLIFAASVISTVLQEML
ncbi:MAG: hypothetical protein WCP12_03220 [bacterium]